MIIKIILRTPSTYIREYVHLRGELDVQSALVGVKAGVLHRQHPGGLACLVVVRVPPARGGGEHSACLPEAFLGVLHPPSLVQLGSHHGVDLVPLLGPHAQVQGDGVVAVGALGISCGQHVEQRPQGVGQRLGGVLSDLVAQQDAHAVTVLGTGLVLDALHLGQQALLLEERHFELLSRRHHTQVLHQRVVVDPIDSSVRRGAVHDLLVALGDHEEVTLGPLDQAQLGDR
mmetsp:Transcript_1064/g.2369  ORF Transcript_1064/g.2369 Transcript_1064/m.2369 type:complete len:230 (+) Transcript_1064:201-890(+)